jgi:hypothetical protein
MYGFGIGFSPSNRLFGGGGAINPLWDGLQAYYTSDNTPDDALGTYNGTLVNGATYGTGIINQGFSFDDVDDYIDISPTLGASFSSPTSAHTYNAWIYPTNITDANNFIVENGSTTNGTAMTLRGSKLGFFYKGGLNVATSTATVVINTWNMVTCVYDGISSVSFYLNGSFVQSMTASWTETAGTTKTVIGSYYGANHFFGGGIDEVGAWNRELTPTELTELYNSGLGKQYIP